MSSDLHDLVYIERRIRTLFYGYKYRADLCAIYIRHCVYHLADAVSYQFFCGGQLMRSNKRKQTDYKRGRAVHFGNIFVVPYHFYHLGIPLWTISWGF